MPSTWATFEFIAAQGPNSRHQNLSFSGVVHKVFDIKAICSTAFKFQFRSCVKKYEYHTIAWS